MISKHKLLFIFFLLLFNAAAAVADFFPSPIAVGGSFTMPAVPVGATSTAPAVTLTFTNAGTDRIDSLTFPPGFINTGTCTLGLTIANGTSCTVILSYTPSSQNPVSGPVQVSCSPVVAIGSAVITCNGLLQSVYTLIGITAALTSVVQSIPVGGPWMISLMSLGLLGMGMFAALRQKS